MGEEERHGDVPMRRKQEDETMLKDREREGGRGRDGGSLRQEEQEYM